MNAADRAIVLEGPEHRALSLLKATYSEDLLRDLLEAARIRDLKRWVGMICDRLDEIRGT